jgi:hypothetical protein
MKIFIGRSKRTAAPRGPRTFRLAENDGGAERLRADSAEVHEHDEDDLASDREVGGDRRRGPTVPKAEVASKSDW